MVVLIIEKVMFCFLNRLLPVGRSATSGISAACGTMATHLPRPAGTAACP